MDKGSKIMHSFLEHIEERFGIYEGQHVPLDQPMIEIDEAAEPELNKPKRSSGKKKYVVYVKNPQTGNVKKVQFGDTTGLSAKINNRDAARNFAARHNCDTKKDKLSPGYWAVSYTHLTLPTKRIV